MDAMFWKVVTLMYSRQMRGGWKRFCFGQGSFSPIPLAVLAVYRVVRCRRRVTGVYRASMLHLVM